MTDKQIKEEIKQVVTNLGNIEFTVEDELEFCKEVLKRKEQECEELKQTLTEIKPILEFYANSKMGEEQPDRTYKIMLSGGYIMAYDPKPARQALQKISEVDIE